MSQIQKVFLGAVALAATLGAVQVGAVQLASGHDLADRWQAVADKPGHNVNRSSKADRLADIKQAAVPTRTVSMRLNDLADTSVLLRVPLVMGRTVAPARACLLRAPGVMEPGNAKPPVLLPDKKQSRKKPTIASEPM